MFNIIGRLTLCLLTLALVFILDSPAGAFDLGRISLKGLDGVHVGVMKLNFETKTLTRDGIRKEVELQLKKAGIKVLSPKECLLTPGAPTLNIGLKVFKDPDNKKKPGHVYAVSLQLVQGVFLARDADISLHADTWKTNDWGRVAELDTLTEKVEQGVDKFIQSYQAANDAQKGMKRKTLEMPSPKKPIDKKGEQSSEDQPAAPEGLSK